jgi:3-hydroxymyristoyl/3-hydroxydecanoyl-(acyl carrier protein) dehydratase
MIPLPPVLARHSGDEERITLFMDAGLKVFEGHFPGDPIVPGVAQVDWAIQFGAAAYGSLGLFLGIDHLKFQDLIRPGETLELALSFEREQGRLRFRFTSPQGRKSAGTACFAPLP